MTLQERLAEVMAAKNWEHADVVRVSGQSSAVVSQWRGFGNKERPTKSINKMAAAMRLAEASGFCALWIAKGTGPKHPAATDVDAEAHYIVGIYRRLPADLRQRLLQEAEFLDGVAMRPATTLLPAVAPPTPTPVYRR